MDQIIKLESVAQFNMQRGQETLHPLVTVLDQSKSKPTYPARFTRLFKQRVGQSPNEYRLLN